MCADGQGLGSLFQLQRCFVQWLSLGSFLHLNFPATGSRHSRALSEPRHELLLSTTTGESPFGNVS